MDGEVQDQGEIWSLTGRCPPGLSPRSQAYRCGGFGTHEIVLYHELVAMLLSEIELRAARSGGADRREEIRHLEQLQQEWLHQPQAELYDQSPAALIARERAHLPAVVPKGHEHLDHDCPLCRMMADSDQPMIWQLDSYELEQRFATSFCKSPAEWERLPARGRGPARGRAVPPAGPSRLIPWPSPRPEGLAHSFTNMDGLANMPDWESVNVMLFAIGGHMAELVEDLRGGEDADSLVQPLHVRFDDLRMCVRDQGDLLVVRSAVADFVEALQAVAQARHELGEKFADLHGKLDFLQQRYARHLGQDLEATY